MRSSSRVLAMLLVLSALGCEETGLEPCDEYARYICRCDPTACAQVTAAYAGADADLQVTCEYELDCYERADLSGGVCSLYDDQVEDTCGLD